MRVRPGSPDPGLPVRTPDRLEGTARSFKTVLDARPGHDARPAPPSPPTPTPPAAAVRAVLERAVAAERNIDALLAAAARGKTFTPGELLALQAAVFRY